MVWELWRLADGTPYFDTGANLATVRHADGPVGDRFAGAERLWTCRAPTPEAATLLLREWLGPAASNPLEPPAPGAVG